MAANASDSAVSSKAEASGSGEKTALEIPKAASAGDSSEYLEHGSDENPRHKLWVGNLDYRISEYQIIKVLQKFGKIKYFYYPYSKSLDSPQANGYCFVEYATREEAETAKKGLEGKLMLDRTVRVSWSTGRTQSLLKDTATAADSTKSTATTESTSAKINAIEAKLKLMQSGQEAVVGLASRPRPKTPYDRPGQGRGGRRGGRGDGFRRRY